MTRRWAAGCGVVFALAAPSLPAGSPPVTVRFQGEVQAEWTVEPGAPSVTVARGEIFETHVRVRNSSPREVVAMVVKEIQPSAAAGALIHLGCGPTFTLVLKPGEAAAVPMSYFIADDAHPEVGSFEIAYAVYSFVPYTPEPLQVGERIYAERCVSCHGLQAKGDGPTGRLLAGGVSDLTPALRYKEEQLLLEAIASGVGPMPAFAPALSRAEQHALVQYLRNLGQGAR